jgi:hypothetical protein
MTTSPRLAAVPVVILDPERLLGFQILAADPGAPEDWPATQADLHNKIGGDGGELPPNPPPALPRRPWPASRRKSTGGPCSSAIGTWLSPRGHRCR